MLSFKLSLPKKYPLMNFELLKSESFEINNWSGGTTTQLFIYPKTANYIARNFKFRLSTAKVLAEKSDFTTLPNIHRKMMVLDGKITLKHDNKRAKILEKFDCTAFEGFWNTSSVGTCTDFNLMSANGVNGSISKALILKSQYLDLPLDKTCQWQFIYIYKGIVETEIDSKKIVINKGDLLVLTEFENQMLQLNATENCELIFVNIF